MKHIRISSKILNVACGKCRACVWQFHYFIWYQTSHLLKVAGKNVTIFFSQLAIHSSVVFFAFFATSHSRDFSYCWRVFWEFSIQSFYFYTLTNFGLWCSQNLWSMILTTLVPTTCITRHSRTLVYDVLKI